MGQVDRQTLTKTNTDRFHTPGKPASSSKLRRAPARLGSFGDSPSQVSTPTPSTASTSRSGKRNSNRGQPTLTQIDFVTRSQQPESDDELDYVDYSEKNPCEVIDIEDDEEERDTSHDANYRPPSSTSRTKRGRGVKFKPAQPKPKKTSLQDEGCSGKGPRKSGDKKDKGAQKDDKTLTQMNYVQRILVEPDTDPKLEYAYITPRKRDSKRQTAHVNNVDDFLQQPTNISVGSSRLKRIKLSPRSEGNQLHEPEGCPEKEVIRSPMTPRKSIKTEIPSSQSPESPGVAFITSSQFRSATRSPQKRAFQPFNELYIKEESLASHEPGGFSRNVQTAYIDEKSSPNDPKSPPFSPAQQGTTENTPKAMGQLKAVEVTSHFNRRPGPSQRTVVYETDAESDYGDVQDDPPVVRSSPRDKDATQSSREARVDHESNSPNMESPELPPPPVPEQVFNFGPLPSESDLLSDASICYQRLHPATQFPLEPVPTINTQKMAELFPEESNGLHTLTPSPSSSPMKSRPAPTPEMVSQTQYPNRDQSESQDLDRMPAEVVPESSPVTRHGDSVTLNRRAPTGTGAVVQVESSQAIDRSHGQGTVGQDSGPRGMLSRSQVLTSSVMESIPIPAFWMSSQDSVGEPYCLPDT